MRTAVARNYDWAYAPVPDVNTPAGNQNTGYVTSTVSDAAKWYRAENVATTSGPGEPGFALPRPNYMREPGSAMGTTILAPQRDTMGRRLSLGSYDFSGGA